MYEDEIENIVSKYDELVIEIETKLDKIMSKLLDKKSLPSSADFSNGKGYIQHNADVVNEITAEVMKLAFDNNYLGYEENYRKTIPFIKTQKNFRQHSIVGRYLDGTVFNSTWSRLMCIDSKGREFGQPFYALNPEKSTMEPLNKLFREQTIDKILKDEKTI